MLWRDEYQTRIVEDVDLPHLQGFSLLEEAWSLSQNGCLVGGFSPLSLRQIEVWLRLMQDAQLDLECWCVLIESSWSKHDQEQLRLLVPESRHSSTIVAQDPQLNWMKLVKPDKPERSFACHCQPKATLMVGLPTEDAWERFEAEAIRPR